ncbi:MAG: hypothetical protein LBU32_28625 [Clostridiales bacterium]|jgi:hypothetical protein|nr:hypothetical protein [Clostridiales bacterium]
MFKGKRVQAKIHFDKIDFFYERQLLKTCTRRYGANEPALDWKRHLSTLDRGNFSFMIKRVKQELRNFSEPSAAARKQRKKEVGFLYVRLCRARDAEEAARDNAPENLQGSAGYDAAEECIEA